MANSKKYYYDYEDYEDGGKDATTLAQTIVSDPELQQLNELIIGCWGESYDNSIQALINIFVENKDKLQNIEHLFVGDIDSEECEVSWIIQGAYGELLKALPNLKKLTIKGSNELSLGTLAHDNLESLEIVCGGLPKSVIHEIANSNLPKLNHLDLYIGVEDYGFDGGLEDIKALLKNPQIKKLKYLGLGNSDIQDEIVEAVMESDVLSNLSVLDFSNGTVSDKGAECILRHQDKITHLELLNLNHHFISDEYMEKLEQLPIELDLGEQMENDEEYGNYPLLTE
jgi:Leucine-rich repeat (LRR) protein